MKHFWVMLHYLIWGINLRPFIQYAFFSSVCTFFVCFCATFLAVAFCFSVLCHEHYFNTHYSPLNIHNIFGIFLQVCSCSHIQFKLSYCTVWWMDMICDRCECPWRGMTKCFSNSMSCHHSLHGLCKHQLQVEGFIKVLYSKCQIKWVISSSGSASASLKCV